MSKKVSVSQCMAEIICNNTDPLLDNDRKMYDKMGLIWNELSFDFVKNLEYDLKTYLIEQLGEDMVED